MAEHAEPIAAEWSCPADAENVIDGKIKKVVLKEGQGDKPPKHARCLGKFLYLILHVCSADPLLTPQIFSSTYPFPLNCSTLYWSTGRVATSIH